MENAEIMKKNWYSQFFFCGMVTSLTNPKELNEFVKTILNPHLIQDEDISLDHEDIDLEKGENEYKSKSKQRFFKLTAASNKFDKVNNFDKLEYKSSDSELSDMDAQVDCKI